MGDIAISVSNVSKCYRVFDDQCSRLLHAVWPNRKKGMEEIWALQDISFEIKRGESIAIIGRNGGGKSTLLEILTGTLTPTTGSVKVNGRVSALLELGSGFNPEYSGRDNVILNGLLLGLTKDDILNRFGEIEAFAEIGGAIDRPVKTYSSGMMMRLAFAVQVLCDPDILIIDEALSVGDFFFQQKCLGYIRKLSTKGVTLLFVSHDMATVRDLCRRALFLNRGQLEYDGDSGATIQRFLAQDSLKEIQATEIDLKESEPAIVFGDLKSTLWKNPQSQGVIGTEIVAVCLADQHGEAVHTISIGEDAQLHVWYRAAEIEPVHVGVTIQNKYEQVVNSSGSYPLKLDMPASSNGGILLFKMNIKMNIEAGQYSLKVNLGRIDDKPNQGVVLMETPLLGPIVVTWDYSKDIAPFYGMYGMPIQASLPQRVNV